MLFRYFIGVCLLSLLSFGAHSAKAEIQDSIRLEISEDGKKAWIIHKVEPKETLFGLAKRYKITQEEIIAENPKAKELKINDILRIPYKDYQQHNVYTAPKNGKTHVVEAGENLYRISLKYKVSVKDLQQWNNMGEDTDVKVGQKLYVVDPAAADRNVQTSRNTAGKKIIHTVEEDEYLYVIAKKYDVKIAEIMKWNNLSSDKLSIGQELAIYPAGYTQENTTTTTTNNTTTNTTTQDNNNVEPDNNGEESTKTVNISGYQKVVQKGFGEMIEDENTPNYVGLHKDAPVGTIVSVRNESNGESVFVRIIGKLPSIGANDKILIKVSKNVYKALNAKGMRFPVEVSYIP
ncbi:MAG: LysM peptidoglycan-binding domain-containing protein [Thermonemataceae bacterium]